MEFKAELIICPKGKCPLDLLADMGTEIVDAWILLHDNAVERLVKTVTDDIAGAEYRELYWDATQEYPATAVYLDKGKQLDYHLVYKIRANDISFKDIPSTPEKIFLIKMQEEK